MESPPEIGLEEIRERARSYLFNHYIGLHITLVAVALAVAGVAAATIVGRHASSHLDAIVLWIIWAGSVAAIAVAYGGPMVGAFALPASIPAITDLVLPLLIGIAEILLFSLLITGRDFAQIVNAWMVLIAIFTMLAGLGVMLARRRYRSGIRQGIYAPDLVPMICRYMRILRRDAVEAAFITVLASGGAALNILRPGLVPVAVFPSLITASLLLGLLGHEATSRMWRRLLAEHNRQLDPAGPAETDGASPADVFMPPPAVRVTRAHDTYPLLRSKAPGSFLDSLMQIVTPRRRHLTIAIVVAVAVGIAAGRLGRRSGNSPP